MKIRINSPHGLLVAASVLLAGAVTFATSGSPVSSMSPISTATADDSTGIDSRACDGQTWPHYSPDCLALMAQQSDRETPIRVLTVSQVSD